MMMRLAVASVLILGLLAGPVSAADAVFNVEIEQRKVVGERTLRVTEGDHVTLRWHADEAVSLHLHGYDLKAHVTPDAAAETAFEAGITGRFPVAVHGYGEAKKGGHGHGHKSLIYLEVHPK